MKRYALLVAVLFAGGFLGSLMTIAYLQGRAEPAPAIPKELTSYRDIVKKVLPAVVSIEAKGKARKPVKPVPGQPQGDGEDAPAMGYGSGFLFDPKGVVLTNYHVVEDADSVEVQLRNGRKIVSRDIKFDTKSDLAIIRLETKDPLPYLEFGDSSEMEIGDRVLAFGAPFSLPGSVTAGIVSAKDRSLGVSKYEDFIQTDAALNPGNSGGPLVNLEGKVIGVTAAIKSRTGGFQGVGLAVASNLAKYVAEQLQTNGYVRRGYIGVQIKDVDTPEMAAKYGLSEAGGVLVTNVYQDAPAAKAGVVRGDVIVTLGGKPIKDGRDLQVTVASLPLNKPVEVLIVRDGKKKTLQITIEEQPRDYGSKD
jgi:serine protease Do